MLNRSLGIQKKLHSAQLTAQLLPPPPTAHTSTHTYTRTRTRGAVCRAVSTSSTHTPAASVAADTTPTGGQVSAALRCSSSSRFLRLQNASVGFYRCFVLRGDRCDRHTHRARTEHTPGGGRRTGGVLRPHRGNLWRGCVRLQLRLSET